MSVSCDFCGGPCNPYDESTYKEVAGWVHGKKSDSMTLRAETGKFAHERCVLKAKAGVAPNDPELFPDLSGKEDGPEKVDTITFGTAVYDGPPLTQQVDDELIEEIFEQVAPPPTIAGLGEMLGLKKKDKT